MTASTDAGRPTSSDLPAPVRALTPRREANDPFTEAYEQNAARVLGYLRARGAEDPEAMTQEVFAAFLGRASEITGGAAGARALLFSIAHARLVDHFRERARRPALHAYDPAADLRTTASAEELVVSSDGDRAAMDLLAGLADEYREVIALRVIVGLSISESAEVMGRSDGAIKQLQRRALEKLRAVMDERNHP